MRDFEALALPMKEELFPSPAEDPFFAALIAEKCLNRQLLADIVEYSFQTRWSRLALRRVTYRPRCERS